MDARFDSLLTLKGTAVGRSDVTDAENSSPLEPHRRMSIVTRRLGRTLFAFGWIGLGLTHFVFRDFIAGRAPGWPEGWPGQAAFAYLTGTAFVLSGVAVLSGKWARKAAVLTGILVAAWALARHVPVLAGAGLFAPEWTHAGKAFLFLGAALAVGASFAAKDGNRRSDPRPPGTLDRFGPLVALVAASAFLILTGIQHFLHTPFVAGLIPRWFPGDPVFWTRSTGVALIGGGVGMLVPATRAWAALLAGSMVLSWFFIVHVTREVGGVGDGVAVHEVLVVAGVLFLLAARPDESPLDEGSTAVEGASSG